MKIVLFDGFFPPSLIRKYFELSGLGTPHFYDYHLRRVVTEDLTRWYYVSKNDLGDRSSTKHIFTDENFFDIDKIPRDDPNFVLAVETIKPEKFRVIDIPDDVKWYIQESESGYESIHEVHRTWG